MGMQIGFALFNGLTVGMSIFLVAAGITLVFGMLKILNIAHGSFFMIGAYVAFSIVGSHPDSTWQLVFAAILSGFVLAALGLLLNASVFQRLRNIGEAYSLIATFALLMICNGATKIIWGVNYHSISAPDALAGAVIYGSFFAPSYSLFIIGLGVLTFLVLEIVIHRSSVGKIVRAIAHDPWMANLVGINTSRIYALVVMAAFFCLGMAGGLLLPNQSLTPLLFESYLLQSFMVVIIGGLGNIRGAFIGAIMLGLIEGANFLTMPGLPGILVYVILIGFLLWRPQYSSLSRALTPPTVWRAWPKRTAFRRPCRRNRSRAALWRLSLSSASLQACPSGPMPDFSSSSASPWSKRCWPSPGIYCSAMPALRPSATRPSSRSGPISWASFCARTRAFRFWRSSRARWLSERSRPSSWVSSQSGARAASRWEFSPCRSARSSTGHQLFPGTRQR